MAVQEYVLLLALVVLATASSLGVRPLDVTHSTFGGHSASLLCTCRRLSAPLGPFGAAAPWPWIVAFRLLRLDLSGCVCGCGRG